MTVIDGYTFEGRYAELFENYVKHKRSLGYKYPPRQIRALSLLNRYLLPYPEITKDVAENWTAKSENESFRTQEGRTVQLRQFALYLNSIEIKAFVPPIPSKKPRLFVPHIFTKDEISAILKVADSMAYEYRSPFCHIIYPLLIRLLYCTGLRISEALAIEIADIDFEERLIRIKQAKHNNSRLIPLPDSLWRFLQDYLNQINRKIGFLFQNRWGNPYGATATLPRFKAFMRLANTPLLENGRLPRLHDLRHTFAVHSLEQMIEQGVDVYVTLPFLSDFLGHRTIASTEQYLRLTSESFGRITIPAEAYVKNLYPQEMQCDENA